MTIEREAAAQKASVSSFYAAMRLLPREGREAMYAIYAFCRAVDDIADDGTQSRVVRGNELEVWRDNIEAVYQGGPSLRAAFLEPAILRYRLRKMDFLALIDGMEMDVTEDIRAPDLATLDLYCDRVASAVGRLSIKAFGMEEEPGFRLAHHLGRALQLTNMLRDLDEDAALGRLYLPRELLEKASVAVRDPVDVLATPAIDAACRGVAQIAWHHYREADDVLRRRPPGNLRAPRMMSAVYASLLTKMEGQGWSPPRARVRVAKSRLFWIFLRHGLFA